MSLWPKDLLRPNQPFIKTFEKRAAVYGVQPPEWATKVEAPKKGKADDAPAAPAAPLDSKKELADLNTLFTLLENRYSKRYPLSAGVLKPTSKPEYYEKLMEEIERAPTKTWWQAKMDEWKMKIRWQ
jgi:cytochrome b pre-mRNA-processing protein 6